MVATAWKRLKISNLGIRRTIDDSADTIKPSRTNQEQTELTVKTTTYSNSVSGIPYLTLSIDTFRMPHNNLFGTTNEKSHFSEHHQ